MAEDYSATDNAAGATRIVLALQVDSELEDSSAGEDREVARGHLPVNSIYHLALALALDSEDYSATDVEWPLTGRSLALACT